MPGKSFKAKQKLMLLPKRLLYIYNSKRLRQIFINNFSVYKNMPQALQKRRDGVGKGADGTKRRSPLQRIGRITGLRRAGQEGIQNIQNKAQNSSTPHQFMCSVHSNGVWCYNRVPCHATVTRTIFCAVSPHNLIQIYSTSCD